MLQGIALTVIGLYVVVSLVLYLMQTRLIFYPGHLSKDFRYSGDASEVFLTTADGERINGLFFPAPGDDVVLFFHGNAGDLSGWQYVAEDFTDYGYSVFIIDYRGYGKSGGKISEQGLYRDADAAWEYVVKQKGCAPENVIVYGRSIGSGVAVDLASRVTAKGLVLEAPFSTLPDLANEKLPFFFPGIYLKYRFDNLSKIKRVSCPVVFLHGNRDELIPERHTRRLYEACTSKKEMIIFSGGSHNDLNAFPEHRYFMEEVMRNFFDGKENPR